VTTKLFNDVMLRHSEMRRRHHHHRQQQQQQPAYSIAFVRVHRIEVLYIRWAPKSRKYWKKNKIYASVCVCDL